MPEPGATSHPIDNAPGADVTWDKLFGDDPEASAASGTTAEPPQTTTTQQTAAAEPSKEPPQATWELRNSAGTVHYTSPEAAIAGIEHKDTLIQQLRDRYKAVTGQDPLKPTPSEPAQVSYLQDPTKFAEDLAAAAKKGDAREYTQTQLKLFDEYISPIKPLIQEFARTRAQAQVSSEIKEFEPFRASEDFKKTLERNPALSQAIQAAESNVQFHQQLPELYRLAYQSHVASKVPELVQAAQAAATQTTTRTTPTQTSTQTTLAPGQVTTSQSDQDMLRSKEGRAELKRRFEASGLGDRDWSTLRW